MLVREWPQVPIQPLLTNEFQKPPNKRYQIHKTWFMLKEQ